MHITAILNFIIKKNLNIKLLQNKKYIYNMILFNLKVKTSLYKIFK